MSDKYRLLDMHTNPNTTKRTRCTAEIAQKYISKEGHPKPLSETISKLPAADARHQVAVVISDAFGSVGLGCEPYLLAALYRWMLGRGRTGDTWTTYSARMCRWVRETARLSLSAQTATTPSSVSDFLFGLQALGLSERTIASHRDVLRSWFGWLEDRDLVHRSPLSREIIRAFRVDQDRVEKADGSRQALVLNEAQRVAEWALREAAPVAGLAVLLLVSASLRSSEVAALERRHLVEQEGVWYLTIPGKGKKSRRIQLEAVAVAAWQRYELASRLQGNRGPLLRAPDGGHYCTRQIQRWAKAAALVVGRSDSIASHDMRRTSLTLLVENGGTLQEAQRQAGHANIQTTVRCYVVRNRAMTARTGIEIPKEET
jgi:site-specific recombinase XerC